MLPDGCRHNEDVGKLSVDFRTRRCGESDLHRCPALDDRHHDDDRSTPNMAKRNAWLNYSTSAVTAPPYHMTGVRTGSFALPTTHQT